MGLEQAGFVPVGLVDNDNHACLTLKLNRPAWNVLKEDISNFNGAEFAEVDLLAAGIPCPPFSKAGFQLGSDDERDLFPHLLRILEDCLPKAVMIENVRGLLDSRFSAYRSQIQLRLEEIGYTCRDWRLLNAADFGVPQLRSRAVLVAFREDTGADFSWPQPLLQAPPTVGEVLCEQMGARGWRGAVRWAAKANRIAPTLVGGSKKHGGPDLGPTRARREWLKLGVDGSSVADDSPASGFSGFPKLTVRMAATLQGFPLDWEFSGRKTAAYRQVGNAFPPPVARAVATCIFEALANAAVASSREAVAAR